MTDPDKTTKRPPKRNLAEAVRLIEQEAERCKIRALNHQAFADDPRLGADVAYWQRSAAASIKKAQRLGAVADWLERSYV